MSHLLDSSAKGVYTISATPFTDSGDIDWPSVDSLVEFYLQCRVQGLTVLGMMGEAQKLSDQESAEFTRRFLRCVNDRVPVIVGVSNPGTANLVKLSKVAMDAGACGVMVAPLTGLKTEAQIVTYFADVIASRPHGALGPALLAVVVIGLVATARVVSRRLLVRDT